MCFPRRRELVKKPLWGLRRFVRGPLAGELGEGGSQDSSMLHLGGGQYLRF